MRLTPYYCKSDVDYKALLEKVPDLYLVLDCDFNIVAVTDAYLQATMVKREEILGRGIFDVFPDNPNDPTATGVKNLRHSLELVIETKAPHTMAVQKYDIQRPSSEGGGFEERYWSPKNSPVLDQENKLLYIIHRVEDVTELIQAQKSKAAQDQEMQAMQSRTGLMQLEIYHRAKEIEIANKQLEQLSHELKESNQRLGELTIRDPLTGLFNRRYLNQALNRELDRAEREHKVVALFMADIDFFKTINDEHGHSAGDVVLKAVGQCFMVSVRKYDIVCRYGGEEFTVILFDTSAAIALERAEKLRKAVESMLNLQVTISIGIALYPAHAQTAESLIKEADRALYLAKQAGRNRVIICPDASPVPPPDSSQSKEDRARH